MITQPNNVTLEQFSQMSQEARSAWLKQAPAGSVSALALNYARLEDKQPRSPQEEALLQALQSIELNYLSRNQDLSGEQQQRLQELQAKVGPSTRQS